MIQTTNFKNISNIYDKTDPIVVLAAGGKGTRIRSMNNELPKPMIPIAGKPILEWEIECLVSQCYTDIIITVSHLSEKIINYFGDGVKFGCNITYYNEEQPLGNAGALFKLWDEGRLSRNFIFLISDAIFSFEINRMLEFHQVQGALATIFTHPNSHPYDSGLVICDDLNNPFVVTNWLNKEDERPEYYKNRVNAGLHILTTDLLSVSGINPASVGVERCVDLDRDVLKRMIPTGQIFSYTSSEYCKDAGTPERFKLVEKDLKSGVVASHNLTNSQRAIFLDRDGVINRYVGYLTSPPQFELVEGVAEAIRLVNNSGYLCIVVTNQPVLARGECTVKEINTIHNKMETLLGLEGAYIDSLYYCPHHPHCGYPGEVKELKIDCDCRKPKVGMLLRASRDFNIRLEDSWMIGDSWRDIECGSDAGTHTIFLNGEGTEMEYNNSVYRSQNIIVPKDVSNNAKVMDFSKRKNITPDYIFPNLLEAVKMILG